MNPQQPSQPDDQLLLDRAASGDAQALAELYIRHRDWVSALAMRFTGQNDLAMDVLQETFVYLARKLAAGPMVLTARLTTFLFPVVKNLSIKILQKSRRMGSSLEEMPDSALPQASDADPSIAARQAELETLVDSLPDHQKQVLLMRFVDDLTLGEIALLLKIPVGTVKSRLHLAIAALKRDPAIERYFLPPS